jgi:hypothetical protein
MGRQHQWRGTVGENQHWQNEIIVHWEEPYWKITATAEQVTAELNIYHEDPVSIRTVWCSFTNPASMVGWQLLDLWLLKEMLTCINDYVMTVKPGHQTTGNVRMIWSDELPFTLFLTSQRVYVWRTPKEAYNLECWFQQWSMEEVLWWLGSNTVVFCWSHYYPSWLNYCKRVHGEVV